MAVATRPTMLDSLPAVFRERDSEYHDFLARFLVAFESLQRGLEREAELIPHLFSLAPIATLRAVADVGSRSLPLDSATGLCEGDVVQIGDALMQVGTTPRAVEFGRIDEVRGSVPTPLPPRTEELRSLLPTIARLKQGLRYKHLTRAPIRVVGDAGVSSVLADGPSVPQNETQGLSIAGLGTLRLFPGAVLRVGETEVDYAQVIDVAPTAGRVTITPPLPTGRHRAGALVAVMELASTTAPLSAFVHAERTGAELLVEAPARAGDSLLHLDTHAGIYADDLLQTLEHDLASREVVRVERLPPGQPESLRVNLRGGLRLARPLERDHAPGTPVRLLTPTGVAGVLQRRVRAGASALRVAGLDIRELAPGNVLRVGGTHDADFVEIAAIVDDEVLLLDQFQSGHRARMPVVKFEARSGGTGFLRWLAGLVGLELRENRGERFNRELARAASWIWRWRGTRRGIEAFLQTFVRGQARAQVLDPSNPMQVGFISRLGVDSVVCGRPHFFWADLFTNERDPWMYDPRGLAQVAEAARDALRREKPAHTFYSLRLRATTMQLGTDPTDHVGARVGETTLLWDEPLITADLPERRAA